MEKKTWKVFRISELLVSHNEIYPQLFTGKDKMFQSKRQSPTCNCSIYQTKRHAPIPTC